MFGVHEDICDRYGWYCQVTCFPVCGEEDVCLSVVVILVDGLTAETLNVTGNRVDHSYLLQHCLGAGLNGSFVLLHAGPRDRERLDRTELGWMRGWGDIWVTYPIKTWQCRCDMAMEREFEALSACIPSGGRDLVAFRYADGTLVSQTVCQPLRKYHEQKSNEDYLV